MGEKVKRLLSAAVSGVMLLTMTAALPIETNAASVCTVNTNKTYQRIRGFGGINLPEWAGSDMTEAQVQKAFGNGTDELGLSILRIYVSDDSSAWSRAVPTAKRAQALGATVFATPWNPPASIRINVDGTNKYGKYQLNKSKYADYAKHLNNYCKYMEGQGINLYSVSIQNEPDNAADWTYWSASDLASFMANYGKAVTAGTNVKLMSPESFQYRKDIYNAIFNNAQALANCDLFGTHFYGTQRSQMDSPAIENSGKELWMTEVYVPNSNANSANNYPEALQVSENIHNGLVVGGLNAYDLSGAVSPACQ
ncbi:MAG: endo-xylanase, partial [Oscillospiraceae bacterium]|nr:endo-xylanase [Oscillospiraceae bacterium]